MNTSWKKLFAHPRELETALDATRLVNHKRSQPTNTAENNDSQKYSILIILEERSNINFLEVVI